MATPFNENKSWNKLNSLLKGFGDYYQSQAALFAKYLYRALKDGQDINTAIQIATKKTAFFNNISDDITNRVVTSVAYGYGIVPTLLVSQAQVQRTVLSRSWTPDRMRLSERLYSNTAAMRQSVIDTLNPVLLNNKTVKQISRQLYEGYGKGKVIDTAQLPKYLDQLENAARRVISTAKGDPKALKEFNRALVKARANVDQLARGGAPTTSLKAAYANLVDAAERLSTKALNSAVNTAIQERSRYYAERISRTETTRAFGETLLGKFIEDEDVAALRWKLGSRHPKYDICDLYANADVFGMGRGVYPKDLFPMYPAHPHCNCRPQSVLVHQVTSVSRNVQDRLVDRYLKSIPAERLRHLLGRDGFKQYITGTPWSELLSLNLTAPVTRFSNVNIKEE